MEKIFDHFKNEKCVKVKEMNFGEIHNDAVLRHDVKHCNRHYTSYIDPKVLKYKTKEGKTIGIYLHLENKTQGDTWIWTINFIGRKDEREKYTPKIRIYKRQDTNTSGETTTSPSFTYIGPASDCETQYNKNPKVSSFTLTDIQISKYSNDTVLFEYDLQLPANYSKPKTEDE